MRGIEDAQAGQRERPRSRLPGSPHGRRRQEIAGLAREALDASVEVPERIGEPRNPVVELPLEHAARSDELLQSVAIGERREAHMGDRVRRDLDSAPLELRDFEPEPEPEAAAERIRGFLKPGGRMAIASWGTLDRVPMLGLTIGTLVQRVGIAPPPKGMLGPLSRPTPEELGALLEGGGFSNVEVEELEVVLDYESPEDFVECLRDIAPPITALLKQHPQRCRSRGGRRLRTRLGKRPEETSPSSSRTRCCSRPETPRKLQARQRRGRDSNPRSA